MPKIGVFVQARLNSTRLPGKMLKRLAGKTLIELSLEAAKRINADEYALLTTKEDAPFFKSIAWKYNFSIIIGPEENVLERFIIAIKRLDVDIVVRITGDKVILADTFIQNQLTLANNYDLISYDEPPLVSVTGGVFKSIALLKAYDKIKNKKCLEHIKPCIDMIRGEKKIIKVPEYLKKFKKDITIDTRRDLILMRNMFNDLYKGYPIYFLRAYEWLEKNG